MNTSDINRPVTAHALNENLFKQFNVRINFDKYTREDLENYRNILRTKISQVESGANFNELLTNENYQKDKYVLGVLNTRIKEMLGEAKLAEKKLTGAETKKKEKIVKSMKKDKGDFEKRYGKRGKWKSVSYKTADGRWATKDVKEEAEQIDEISAGLARRAADKAYDLGAAERRKTRGNDASPLEKKRNIQGRNFDRYANKKEMANEEQVNELSPELIRTAQAKRHGQLSAKSGGARPTPSTINQYHDRQKLAIGADFRDAEAQGLRAQPGSKDQEYAKNERNRARNMSRGKMINVANKKLQGTANVPAKSVGEGNTMRTTEAKKAKPDFLDMDKDGNKKEPMKKAVANKKKKEPANEMFAYDDKGKSKQKPQDVLGRRKPGEIAKYPDDFKSMKKDKRMSKQYPVGAPKGKLPESTNKHFKESRLLEDSKTIIEAVVYYLREDEEGKAKAITSGVDMVNDFTSWMQRVANYQTKTMIELADSIRANFGVQESETFKASVGAALENALNSLTSAREEINNAVAVLAGEAPAAEPMGREPDMDAEMGMSEPDELNVPGEDEFAASDAAAGGPETLGRMKRESIDRGNRLMKILGS